jgi:cytochrome c peroxidase
MLGMGFPGMSDEAIRAHLAARIGDYASGQNQLATSTWLARFRSAFASNASAEHLITFDNIAIALAEYQRSALFVETPWSRYVRGDVTAISLDAKRGALVFFRDTNEGGAQCAQCHSGDRFTDEKHHVLGFPQVGPGMGDPNSDDVGRQRQSANAGDRYRFRTPSLLNIEVSAPYGHSGSYANLDTVFSHYALPQQTLRDVVVSRSWCFQAPFTTQPNCSASASIVSLNSEAALARMFAVRAATPSDAMPVIDLNAVPPEAIPQMSAFLRSLTDPCVKDRTCLERWIPRADEAPDQHQLNAVDRFGNRL